MAEFVSDSTKLEACPFCGGPGHLQHSTFEIDSGWHVVCHGQKDCPLYCSEPYQVHGDEADAATRWNTRAAPPAMDREAVARIVDPNAFKSRQSLYDYCISQGDTEDEARRIADDTHKPDCDKAFSKADAILSTLSADAIRQGEGWQPIETAVLWDVYVVTDGVNVAMSQYAESDHGDRYWAVEPEDALEWEPTHCIATPASHASDGEGA